MVSCAILAGTNLSRSHSYSLKARNAVSETQPSNPWRTRIGILLSAHAVGTLHSVSILALAPVIRPDLGLSFAEFGLLMTAYSAGQVTGSVPSGAYVDRVGVGWGLVTACAILCTGAVILTQADGHNLALLAMLVVGWGYSLTNPATARGVLEWFPPNRRATAIGVKQTGVPVGGVLAAGTLVLSAYMAWQTIIWIIIGATIANALICATLVQKPKPRGSDKANLFVEIYRLFGDRNLGALFLASGFLNTGQYNFFTYLTSFMRDAAQASQELASLTLGIAQAVSAVGRIGWGALSDTMFRGRRKWLTVGVCVAAALFFVAMAAAGRMQAAGLGMGVAVLLGLTIASYATLMQTMSVEAVPSENAGAALGYTSLGSHTGAMVGPPVFGAVIDATGRFSDGYLLTGAIVAFGVLLFAIVFREKKH